MPAIKVGVAPIAGMARSYGRPSTPDENILHAERGSSQQPSTIHPEYDQERALDVFHFLARQRSERPFADSIAIKSTRVGDQDV